MDVDMKSPSPLAFDRVMKGTGVAAHNSPLFKISTEILTIIFSYLFTSDSTLASLALVNSDCRQLARSCQFWTLKFDATPRSESILGILQRDAVERRQNRGHALSLIFKCMHPSRRCRQHWVLEKDQRVKTAEARQIYWGYKQWRVQRRWGQGPANSAPPRVNSPTDSTKT